MNMKISLSKLHDFDQSCLPFSKAIVCTIVVSVFYTGNKMVLMWQNHLLSEETDFSGNVFFSQNCENDLLYYIHLE